ncbi:hypothetical protein AVEN_192788-1 [Araneus ventricosus]|uniref:HAT C-terminal dimerisation domain-containing protein n=1 Tax=Araneus ventricosus TaxID=182803 RepID=A0A4Y2SP50_ARAVE|nr:hypothetical protein AVEN_192788-1 [Araneus ventricosus]
MKKKESGAEGRKRREIDAKESERASKFMKTFFVRPRENKEKDIAKQKELIPVMPKAIEEHDIGLLKFNTDTGKPDAIIKSAARKNKETPEQLLQFIVSYGDESVFPNLRIALQILLTIPTSTASCERSFSKLKLSYLRASTGQKRLCDLALLSIEKVVT